MQKVYTIQIKMLNNKKSGVWYESKEGDIFEAILKIRSDGNVAFYVGTNKFINPLNCTVLSEKIIYSHESKYD